MIRNLSLIMLGAAALTACNSEQPEPVANELANSAPIELPPAIAASKAYRCKDNSIVRIDWLADKSAYIHGEGQTQTRVQLAEPAEGEPASTDLVAEGGYVLKGDAAATSISVTLPGKDAQACHV